MVTVEEAFAAVKKSIQPLSVESVPLSDAVGRVLAAEIRSDVDSPPHNKSVMDGFAVRAEDIAAGVTEFRVLETIIAGSSPTCEVVSGTTSRIMTGAPMPTGADATVMIEQSSLGYTDPTPETVTLNVTGDFFAGKHQMDRAGNFAAGDLMFSAGHRIRPVDVGLLAEVGAANLQVYKQPRIAVLPTGDELVDCSQTPSASQIRNSNGPMIAAVVSGWGAEVTDLGIGIDDKAQLEEKIAAGLKQDVLILSGGVSAGTMDFVPDVLTSLGVKTIFHKVEVKPGKPILFGIRDDGENRCVVFGLPGNPVSSLVGLQLFVSTAFALLTGRDQATAQPPAWDSVLAADHETRGNRPTYWPGRRCVGSDPFRVEALPWNGSSDLLSLRSAEGLIHFPVRSTPYQAGEKVEFLPFL